MAPSGRRRRSTWNTTVHAARLPGQRANACATSVGARPGPSPGGRAGINRASNWWRAPMPQTHRRWRPTMRAARGQACPCAFGQLLGPRRRRPGCQDHPHTSDDIQLVAERLGPNPGVPSRVGTVEQHLDTGRHRRSPGHEGLTTDEGAVALPWRALAGSGWEPCTQPRTGRFRWLVRIAHGPSASRAAKQCAQGNSAAEERSIEPLRLIPRHRPLRALQVECSAP
jgi:hypothetical protein